MTNKERKSQLRIIRRKKRSRAKMSGTQEKPRLHVFRGLKHISAQIINDVNGTTLVSSHSRDLKAKGNKTEQAKAVGKDIGTKAKSKGIATVVFDRSGYKFHGRIKALADAAREAGLQF